MRARGGVGLDRRTFLKSIGGCGVAAAAGDIVLARSHPAPAYIGLHPFIEAHPEAVFIRRTAVGSKDDAAAKKEAALSLGRRSLRQRASPGISLSHKFAIKPNLTSGKGTGLTLAIVT